MKTTTWFLVVLSAFTIAGCKKKAVVASPPPAVVKDTPPPPQPAKLTQRAPRVDSFTAEPARVERGQSITLRWATTDADTVTIDQNVGTVPGSGSRQLFPNATTTYVLIARNSTGTDTRTVTVDMVNAPTTTAKPVTGPSESDEQKITRLVSQMQDIYFDYDMSELRDDARRAANTDADILKQVFAISQSVTFVVEGHADERGSAEYNLGLGDRRASIARDTLVSLGVPASRLRTVSFGEEMPVCRESNESCWQKNRRAHLTRQ